MQMTQRKAYRWRFHVNLQLGRTRKIKSFSKPNFNEYPHVHNIVNDLQINKFKAQFDKSGNVYKKTIQEKLVAGACMQSNEFILLKSKLDPSQ